MCSFNAERRGVTLVELLVVFVAIAILTAIALPALTFAREAARTTHCRNNLKQVGLAVHTFDSSQGHVPGTTSFWISLCPYLGAPTYEQELRARIEWEWQTPPPSPKVPRPRTPFALVCPSDSLVDVEMGYLSYCLSNGLGYGFEPEYGVYWAWHGYAGRLRHLTDGQSNTVLASERLVPHEYYRHLPNPNVEWRRRQDPRRVARISLRRFLPHERADFVAHCMDPAVRTIAPLAPTNRMQTMSSVMQFDHKFPPNCWPFSNIDQTGQPWQDGGGNPASSLHVGGVNVLFADGSVRFIPDSIDLELWRRLGTFNAGDISKP